MTEDLRPPFRQQFDNARDPYTARNALGITATGGGGPSSAAPDDAQYIVAATDPVLTNERVLTNTASITWDFSVPGQAKANTAGGGGNVSNVGTPTLGQYAKWTTATTIQGVSAATVLGDIGAAPLASPTFTGDPKAPTPATADNDTSIATTAYVQAQGYLTSAGAAAAYQPLDADLTSLAAAAATGAIYYRSAANTWATVTIGTGLSFTSGTLASTVTAGAPVGAEYITSTADATLTSERVLTDTATVTWDRTVAGQIKANAVSGGGTATPVPPQGRLTLQTGVPVMTTTQSAKTAIFYTPYCGNQIVLYNGTNMVPTTFNELTVATTNTANSPAAIGASKINDWFVWDSGGGTLRLVHGPDWTNDTTRSAGTALVMVNGVLLNNAAITNGPAAQRGTYVGTTRSNASSQLDWIYGTIAAGAAANAFLGVWNAYNRVDVETFSGDTTDSTTTSNGGFQQTLAAHKITFVSGLAEDAFRATYCSFVGGNTTSFTVSAIGYDVTNAKSGTGSYHQANITSNGTGNFSSTALGCHFVAGIEAVGGGTATISGDFGTATLQSGLHLRMRM